MTDWLPSLNALRAFEAVCRHLNFARAAEELRVTPAAVKQLVDKLEVAVGHPLVQRSGRGLALTAAGASGHNDLAAAFAQLQRAVERMRRHSDRQRLIVSVDGVACSETGAVSAGEPRHRRPDRLVTQDG